MSFDNPEKEWKDRPGLSWFAVLCAVCALVAAGYLFLKFLAVPPDDLYFNDFPPLRYSMELARRFYAANGSLWGYDPHYMAGYPAGYIWNGHILLRAVSVWFSSVPVSRLLWIIMVSGVGVMPVMWWVALRVAGWDRRSATTGFVFGMGYMIVGMPMLFFVVGMVHTGWMVPVCVLGLSAVYGYASRGGTAGWLMLVVIGVVAPALHPSTVPAIAAGVLCATGVAYHGGGGRRVALMAAAFVPSLFVNFEWLVTVASQMHYISPVPEAPFWRNYDLLLPLKEYFGGMAVMNTQAVTGMRGVVHSIVLCAIAVVCAGAVAARSEDGEGRGRVMYFAIVGGVLWIFGYYGAWIPGTGEMNPAKYVVIAQMMFACAAPGVAAMRHDHVGTALVSMASIAVIGAVGWCVVWYGALAPVMSAREPAAMTDVKKYIGELEGAGRIMIEDTGRNGDDSRGQPYGEGYGLSLFGITTGREFIGGPYPYVILQHRHAAFFDGRAFGKKIEDIPPDEFVRNAALYNVDIILCWSPSSVGYFRRFDGVFSAAGINGGFAVFRIRGAKPDWFLRGSGKVKAGYDRIVVRDAVSESGMVALKYHWVEGLEVKPRGRVVRYRAGGDPVGFVGVAGAPPDFVVELRK